MKTDLTDRLTSPDTGIEPALWLPLLHLLTQGDPVAIGASGVTGVEPATAGSLLDEILPAQPVAPGKGAPRCAC